MKFYSSRNVSVIRYVTAMITAVSTAIFVNDSEFRMFMLIVAFVIGMVLFIFKLFWNGIDNGTITAFYSEDNLKKRESVVNFCGIIVFYFTFFTLGVYCVENNIAMKLMIVFFAVAFLLFISEVFLFFKAMKEDK